MSLDWLWAAIRLAALYLWIGAMLVGAVWLYLGLLGIRILW